MGSELSASKVSEFRTATPEHATRIAHMLRRFYLRLAPECYGIAYDHESMLSTVLECIERGVCLIGERSCAGALFYPFPFNFRVKVGQVVFWYYESMKEIAIFDELDRACREAGADALCVSALSNRLIGLHFYAKRGLHLAEGNFMKLYASTN